MRFKTHILGVLIISLFLTGCAARQPIIVPMPPAPLQPPLPITTPALEWRCKSWSEVIPCPVDSEISAYFRTALADINKLRKVNPEYDESFFKAATEIIFRKIEGCNERGCGFYDEWGVLAHGSFNPFVAPWKLEVATAATLGYEFLHEIWFMNWSNETCADVETRVWREIGHGGECDPMRKP